MEQSVKDESDTLTLVTLMRLRFQGHNVMQISEAFNYHETCATAR
jgi:hypothetical protein